jgi:hypothetical protein
MRMVNEERKEALLELGALAAHLCAMGYTPAKHICEETARCFYMSTLTRLDHSDDDISRITPFVVMQYAPGSV